MKKSVKPIHYILIICLLVGLSCYDQSPVPDKPSPENNQEAVRQAVLGRAREAVSALQTKDMNTLAALTHPEEGLRFSPWAFVDVSKDLVFKPDSVKTFFTLKEKLTWGYEEGSGEAIRLTPSRYFERFVYVADFAAATVIGYNQTIGKGNTKNNIPEAYPQAVMVEYHLPGSRGSEGEDWKSLRLVFKQKGNEWFLVGVVHDERTI